MEGVLRPRKKERAIMMHWVLPILLALLTGLGAEEPDDHRDWMGVGAKMDTDG